MTEKKFDPTVTLREIEDKFEMLQILNEEGEIVNEAEMPDLSDDELVELMSAYFRSTFDFIKPSRTSWVLCANSRSRSFTISFSVCIRKRRLDFTRLPRYTTNRNARLTIMEGILI